MRLSLFPHPLLVCSGNVQYRKHRRLYVCMYYVYRLIMEKEVDSESIRILADTVLLFSSIGSITYSRL